MSAYPTADKPMLLFGCGNMGRAMLDGWLAAGFDPAVFVVIDPSAVELPPGVVHYRAADELGYTFQTALIAIKPQMFEALAADLDRLLVPSALVISILAGTRINRFQARLPGRTILRIMPNLAAALGKSPLGLFSDSAVDRAAMEALLQPLGTTYWLASEGQMDAVTALVGSGPAFVYRFIDTLAKAGEGLGLEPDLALGLARSMVNGASELAARSNASPEELARKVTSPGGTTAAGLAVLDADGALAELIAATLRAARDRGIELSGS